MLNKIIGFATVATLALAPNTLIAQDATTGSLRKLKDVVLFEDARFHAAFPSVVALPGGELFCAFRRAPSRQTLWQLYDRHVDANSYLVGVRSTDQGETWTSEPVTLYAHAFGGSQDPCLLRLADDTLLCASYGWSPVPADVVSSLKNDVPFAQEFGFLGGYLVRSRDNGKTWDGPVYPPPVKDTIAKSAIGGDLPAYNRGAMVQNSAGAILWAVVRHDTMNPGRTSVHLMQSNNGGDDWEYVSEIASDPTHSLNETSLVIASNGDLLAFLRAELKGGHTAVARSRDGGKTFEPWQDLGFHGLPAQAINLPGNRLLVVYGYRRAPYGIRARVIKEDLSDASTAKEIVLREDGGNADLGYPWALQIAPNRVLVVYYINTDGNPPHIAGTLLEL